MDLIICTILEIHNTGAIYREGVCFEFYISYCAK